MERRGESKRDSIRRKVDSRIKFQRVSFALGFFSLFFTTTTTATTTTSTTPLSLQLLFFHKANNQVGSRSRY